MMIIAANEVKKHGVKIFEGLIDEFSDVILSVRGKKKYVVVDIERYKKMRALELDKAYEEVMQDIENGDFKTMSAKEHIEALKEELHV